MDGLLIVYALFYGLFIDHLWMFNVFSAFICLMIGFSATKECIHHQPKWRFADES